MACPQRKSSGRSAVPTVLSDQSPESPATSTGDLARFRGGSLALADASCERLAKPVKAPEWQSTMFLRLVFDQISS